MFVLERQHSLSSIAITFVHEINPASAFAARHFGKALFDIG
jgi:hypothetical protein